MRHYSAYFSPLYYIHCNSEFQEDNVFRLSDQRMTSERPSYDKRHWLLSENSVNTPFLSGQIFTKTCSIITEDEDINHVPSY